MTCLLSGIASGSGHFGSEKRYFETRWQDDRGSLDVKLTVKIERRRRAALTTVRVSAYRPLRHQVAVRSGRLPDGIPTGWRINSVDVEHR